MNIKFHFFCEQDRKPNVNTFYDYFNKENITEENDKEEVYLTQNVYFKFYDSSTENRANFVLSKINTIENIVNLDRNYFNLRFHVEFPLILSSFHYSQIFEIIEGLNELYPIYFYCEELVKQITPFNKEQIVSLLKAHRDSYVRTAELGSVNKQFYIDRGLHDYVFEYQKTRKKIIDSILDEHKLQVNVNPFIALHKIKHNENHEIKFAVDLNLEYLTIIPRNVDYFYVPTVDGDGNNLVNASIVLKDIDQYLSEYKNFVDGAKITDFDQMTRASKKFQKKLKKYAKKSSSKDDFEIINLYGLLDR